MVCKVGEMSWVIAVTRLPKEPSRHRVAVWRELRRAGALPLGAGTWALPTTPLTASVLDKVRGLVARTPEGELLLLDATGRDDTSETSLQQHYTRDRESEWREFLSDCAKYEAEIDREIAKEKFTLAELEEEEQSLDRLRRWHRELSLRDVFGAPSTADAATALKSCTDRLEDFSERVYAALGQ